MLELSKDVVRVFTKHSAFANEIVAAAASWGVDAVGNREYLTIVVRSHVCGNERSAFQIGLDHDCADRHSRNDAVADGEALLVPLPIKRKLSDDRTVIRDAFVKFRIFCGLHDIDIRTKSGNSAA